jgi:hypothetical protein
MARNADYTCVGLRMNTNTFSCSVDCYETETQFCGYTVLVRGAYLVSVFAGRLEGFAALDNQMRQQSVSSCLQRKTHTCSI